MSQGHTLGVDFGTTNSYFAKCPANQISPVGIDFGGGHDGTATAVLYRGEGHDPLVGHLAVQEWGETRGKEGDGYVLRFHFKPELAVSEEARRCAVDFLKGVIEWAKHRRVDIDPESRQVIFGIPSEADAAFSETLLKVAEEAGYGAIRLVDEPIGALLTHLWRKDLSPVDARDGVLVIDFGGGTCDFAYLRGMKVEHSWGDMEYGGRLFDDLFFQWFVDENPDLKEQLAKDNDEHFVRWFLCREAKEAFSDRITQGSDAVTLRLDGRGSLRGITWEAFLERARSYRPTGSFLKELREGRRKQGILESADGPVDLIGWFRSLLFDGLQEHGLDKGAVSRVLLVGGSSQWRFVEETISEMLDLEPERLLRSDRPYAVVAEGLAILPALQKGFAQKQRDMRKGLPEFVQKALAPFLRTQVAKGSRSVARSLISELFDAKLAPALMEFREKGGSIASLKARIASEAVAFEPKVHELVDEGFASVLKGVRPGAQELVEKWFGEHELHYSSKEVSSPSPGSVEVGADPLTVADPFEAIVNFVSAFAAGMAGWLVAAICGGGGMALIASGPIGWLIGLLIGAVIGYLAARYGMERAKEMAESWEMPAPVAHIVLSKGRISKARTKFKAELEEQLTEQAEAAVSAVAGQIEERIAQQIESLSEIDQL